MENIFFANDIMSKISLTKIPGVGTARSTALARLGLFYVADIFNFFPSRYEDRRNFSKVNELYDGYTVCVEGRLGTISSKRIDSSGRRMLIQTTLEDETGQIQLIFFNRFLDKQLAEGAKVVVYGSVSVRQDKLQIVSPEIIVLYNDEQKAKEQIANFSRLLPVYPLTEGLKQSYVRKLVAEVFKRYGHLIKENLPSEILSRRSLMDRAQAFKETHLPNEEKNLNEGRKRLKYEELFIKFSSGENVRRESQKTPFCKITSDSKDLLENLNFCLTDDQTNAIEEILRDMTTCHMSRLLQGDVGSGKTLVALAVANATIKNGYQVAFLAPTEVLAEQIYEEAKKVAPVAAHIAFLTGKTSKTERKLIEEELSNGKINFVIGTHALFSLTEKFKNLALLIIDEQQRFGVNQRKTLLAIKPTPHLLMMTATPIPRTLTQVLYSDMTLSILKQRPLVTKNGIKRKEITTKIVPTKDVQKLLAFVGSEIKNGGRVYWLCPRVEDDEASNLPAVEKRVEWLARMLPMFSVGLIHGQMNSDEKLLAMDKFKKGECQLLAGTTVLEVGIDVSEASVIVIESPNRYGMSQLHQLRGRVGRGSRRGVCILLVRQDELNERLKFFASTNDGFLIAEKDLENRGSGDTFGVAQHGFANFLIADPLNDAEIFAEAKEDAKINY